MPLTLADDSSFKPAKPIRRPTPAFERAADGGRVLAAVFLPTPPSWSVVPVDPDSVVGHNGVRLTAAARLSPGDVLDLGRKRFTVEAVDEPGDDAEQDGLAPPACEVTARFRGREVGRVPAAGPVLVGTDPGCEIALPAETGLSPVHAVLAHVGGRWLLATFADPGPTRIGGGPAGGCLPLMPHESAWVGEVEVTVGYEELDPLDRDYPAAAGPLPDMTPEPGPPAETPAAAGAPTPHWHKILVTARADCPVQVRALDVCRWLQAEHLRTPEQGRPLAVSVPPPDDPPATETGSAAVLDRFRARLQPNPWEPDGLFGLGVYLWQIGLPDNARWVLKELLRQNPRDVTVLQTLAVLTRAQAADPGRPADDRLTDIRRAHRYAAGAAALRPRDRRVLDLQRAIGSEMTLLELEQAGGSAIRRR